MFKHEVNLSKLIFSSFAAEDLIFICGKVWNFLTPTSGPNFKMRGKKTQDYTKMWEIILNLKNKTKGQNFA